ncbi:hypothetical protein P7C71_g4163, partial [Lecanoromycetidae sp. Uapishka_2]
MEDLKAHVIQIIKERDELRTELAHAKIAIVELENQNIELDRLLGNAHTQLYANESSRSSHPVPKASWIGTWKRLDSQSFPALVPVEMAWCNGSLQHALNLMPTMLERTDFGHRHRINARLLYSALIQSSGGNLQIALQYAEEALQIASELRLHELAGKAQFHRGQQGLVRTTEEPESGQKATNHAQDQEIDEDVSLDTVISSEAEEEDANNIARQNHSRESEPSTTTIRTYHVALVSNEDGILEPGQKRDELIEICNFSPQELLSLKEKLQAISPDLLNDSGGHEAIVKKLTAGINARHLDEEYDDCLDLILTRLWLQCESSLRRAEEAERNKRPSVQPVEPSHTGHLSWGGNTIDNAEEDPDMSSEKEMSTESEEGSDDDENKSDDYECETLQRMLHLAQTTEEFTPGKVVYRMVEMCDFPPEKTVDILTRIRDLHMDEAPSTGGDDTPAEYTSNQEAAKTELQELIVRQLQIRLIEKLANLRMAQEAVKARKATDAHNALEARRAAELPRPDAMRRPMPPIVSSRDSNGMNGTTPRRLYVSQEDLPFVGTQRARGISIVNRTWGATSSLLSGSYATPASEPEVFPKPKPADLPLIMSLDGPNPPTEEEKLAEQSEQKYRMALLAHGKEVLELHQFIRMQKQFYDQALAKDPTDRKAMEKETFKKAMGYLRKATIDTILTRCLVAYLHRRYKDMDQYAAEAAAIAKEIGDPVRFMRSAYISGVALYNLGEEHYQAAYETFGNAQECPGSYGISNKNAIEWKQIVSSALRSTASGRATPRVIPTYLGSIHGDAINAMERENWSPPPVSPSQSSYTRGGEDFRTEDTRDNPDSDRYAPSSSQIPSAPITTSRSHRPILPPITVPHRPSRLGGPARSVKSNGTDLPETLSPIDDTPFQCAHSTQASVPKFRAPPLQAREIRPQRNSAMRDISERSLPRPAIARYQSITRPSAPASRMHSLRNFGDGSVPISAAKDLMRQKYGGTPSMKSRPGSASSGMGTPFSVTFERDVMMNFGGERGGVGSSAQNSYVNPEEQAQAQGRRRRPEAARMSSSASLRRNEIEAWERRVREKEEEGTDNEMKGEEEEEEGTDDEVTEIWEEVEVERVKQRAERAERQRESAEWWKEIAERERQAEERERQRAERRQQREERRQQRAKEEDERVRLRAEARAERQALREARINTKNEAEGSGGKEKAVDKVYDEDDPDWWKGYEGRAKLREERYNARAKEREEISNARAERQAEREARMRAMDEAEGSGGKESVVDEGEDTEEQRAKTGDETPQSPQDEVAQRLQGAAEVLEREQQLRMRQLVNKMMAKPEEAGDGEE